MNKPIKPDITIPQSFAENGVKTDFDDTLLADGFDNLRPDVLAGDNLNKFIDDTYKGLNYGMAAADAINLINEGETLTVKDGKLSSGSVGEGFVKKSGDTMTGNLIIEKPADISAITFKRNDIDTGDTPSETTKIMQLVSQDKNGESVAMAQSYIGTTGASHLQLAVKQGVNSYGTVTLSQTNDGDTFFEFPICRTKATTTSSASSGKVAVVVQNYVNGYSWYRIWSDGWIEQGGQAHATTGLGTLNLTKTFSSVGYCVQVSQATTDEAYTNNHFIMIYEKKTSSFKVKTNVTTATGGIPFSWYACGY